MKTIATSFKSHRFSRSPYGYVADYASDGISALALAGENEYDLIVLDLSLPRMDGLRVCRQLRETLRTKVPIVVLTAKDEIETKIAAFDIGADDYVVKPAALREIEARIRSLIRRARARRIRLCLRSVTCVLMPVRCASSVRATDFAGARTCTHSSGTDASLAQCLYRLAISREIWGMTGPRTARAMPSSSICTCASRGSRQAVLNGNSFILCAVSAIGSHRMNLRYDSLRTRLIWPFVLLGYAVSAILSLASFTIFSALEEQAIERALAVELESFYYRSRAQSGRNTADSFAVARRQATFDRTARYRSPCARGSCH